MILMVFFVFSEISLCNQSGSNGSDKIIDIHATGSYFVFYENFEIFYQLLSAISKHVLYGSVLCFDYLSG